MIYWQIETNLIQQRDELSKSLQNKVPEWAIYFEWIVSDWELNRNWYIIESEAWFFNKWKYVKDFLKTGSILYNHDSDKPIWRPLSFELKEDWKIYVSWFVYDDNYTNGAIWRWLILGLSTWHITHERVLQDTKGKRMSEEEFFNLPYDDYKNGAPWTIVVTKAEIVEFSFVSTRSNRASVLTNDIAEISSKLNMSTNEVESLFFNYKEPMKRENIENNEAEKDIAPAIEVPAEAEVEAKADTTDENKVNTEDKAVETNAILEELASLKTNFSTLENELKEAKENLATLTSENNKLREDKKAELINLANVPNDTNKKELKSVEEFKNKYSTK